MLPSVTILCKVCGHPLAQLIDDETTGETLFRRIADPWSLFPLEQEPPRVQLHCASCVEDRDVWKSKLIAERKAADIDPPGRKDAFGRKIRVGRVQR